MYAIYGNIYHQYTPNVSIHTIHGSYGFAVRFHQFFSTSGFTNQTAADPIHTGLAAFWQARKRGSHHPPRQKKDTVITVYDYIVIYYNDITITVYYSIL